jgi:hypothetical protein
LVNDLCPTVGDRTVPSLNQPPTRFIESDNVVRPISFPGCRHLRHEVGAFVVVDLGAASRTHLSRAEPHSVEEPTHNVIGVPKIECVIGENALGNKVLDQSQDQRPDGSAIERASKRDEVDAGELYDELFGLIWQSSTVCREVLF